MYAAHPVHHYRRLAGVNRELAAARHQSRSFLFKARNGQRLAGGVPDKEHFLSLDRDLHGCDMLSGIDFLPLTRRRLAVSRKHNGPVFSARTVFPNHLEKTMQLHWIVLSMPR